MKNQGSVLLLVFMIMAFAGVLAADRYYMPKFKREFNEVETQRVITSNKLTTAKIVQENLNHVRELVFDNMDFPNQPDTIDHETQFYNFVTACLNDLKLKLVSFKPVKPMMAERITTYGYDVEIEGDFFKFGELCAKFENSRRIMTIESYDVDLVTDNNSNIINVDTRYGGVRSNAAANNKANSEIKDIKVKMRVNTYRIQKI